MSMSIKGVDPSLQTPLLEDQSDDIFPNNVLYYDLVGDKCSLEIYFYDPLDDGQKKKKTNGFNINLSPNNVVPQVITIQKESESVPPPQSVLYLLPKDIAPNCQLRDPSEFKGYTIFDPLKIKNESSIPLLFQMTQYNQNQTLRIPKICPTSTLMIDDILDLNTTMIYASSKPMTTCNDTFSITNNKNGIATTKPISSS